MNEFYRKEAKVQAFPAPITFKLGGIEVPARDWVVVLKDGTTLVYSKEDFEENLEKQQYGNLLPAITTIKATPFEPPTVDFPPGWQFKD